jgi:hypothetical protein
MKHINSELRSILHDRLKKLPNDYYVTWKPNNPYYQISLSERLKSNHFLATIGSELDDQLFKELTILNILYER